MGDPAKLSDVRAQSQRERLDFLQTDLALCFTFADVAATELAQTSDLKAAEQALANAEEGYATVSRFLLGVEDGQQSETIRSKLIELRAKLDRLQQRLHGGAA